MGWRWIRQNGAERAVVVFGGWGFGPAPFAGLSGDVDVLFSDDMTDLPPVLPDLTGYRGVDAVAWSFGVATMGHWMARHDAAFARKVALCGSLNPVDRAVGIPPRSFALTLRTLSPDSFANFANRCCDTPPALPPADIAALATQLSAVQSRGPAPDPGFDRIWIAERDQIFPPANLARAWDGQPVRHIDAPHAPFAALASWQGVLA